MSVLVTEGPVDVCRRNAGFSGDAWQNGALQALLGEYHLRGIEHHGVNRSIKVGGRVCPSLPRPFVKWSLEC